MPSLGRYLASASIKTPAAINPIDGSQTANHANSTSPTSANLSNTEAGYLTLGGRFQFAAVAGAATDYALFAYQVPSGLRLLITGVAISVIVSGVPLVSAAVFDWSIGLKSTAISLATPGIIRTPLGMQGFLALVGIGEAAAPDIVREFDPELVAEHGEYVHIIMQQPVGAATVSLIYRGDVTIQGYFENVLA